MWTRWIDRTREQQNTIISEGVETVPPSCRIPFAFDFLKQHYNMRLRLRCRKKVIFSETLALLDSIFGIISNCVSPKLIQACHFSKKNNQISVANSLKLSTITLNISENARLHLQYCYRSQYEINLEKFDCQVCSRMRYRVRQLPPLTLDVILHLTEAWRIFRTTFQYKNHLTWNFWKDLQSHL